MLLWKSWRDLRIAFFIGLGWLALLAILVIQYALRTPADSSTIWATPDKTFGLVVGFVALQTAFLTVIAFAIGTLGIGREIAGGSGSFLLTCPISRGYYVWTEWFSGLAALGALLGFSIVGLWLAIHFHAIRLSSFERSGNTTTWHTWIMASLPFGVTLIHVLCAFLFLALIFGITHLGTVAFRHATAGLLFSIGFFVAWLVVMEILRHNYPGLAPPDLLLRPYTGGFDHLRLIPGFTSSIAIRLAILPLFPFAAQLFLRRTEV
ncbi:MAG TPA: hypothetical protein VME18_05655 [Acidobacteriaceae bacterium]|nr:hypothetical protein [Acidobacteriaceae bacterium]